MIFASKDGVVVAIMSDEQPMSDDFITPGVAVEAVIELERWDGAGDWAFAGRQGSASDILDRDPVGARVHESEGEARSAPAPASDSPDQEHTRRVTPSEGVHYKPRKQPMKKAR